MFGQMMGRQAIMMCVRGACTHRYIPFARGQQTTVSSATSWLSHWSSRRKLMPSMVILRFVYNLMYGTQLSLMAQFPVANWFGMEHTSPGRVSEWDVTYAILWCSCFYFAVHKPSNPGLSYRLTSKLWTRRWQKWHTRKSQASLCSLRRLWSFFTMYLSPNYCRCFYRIDALKWKTNKNAKMFIYVGHTSLPMPHWPPMRDRALANEWTQSAVSVRTNRISNNTVYYMHTSWNQLVHFSHSTFIAVVSSVSRPIVPHER